MELSPFTGNTDFWVQVGSCRWRRIFSVADNDQLKSQVSGYEWIDADKQVQRVKNPKIKTKKGMITTARTAAIWQRVGAQADVLNYCGWWVSGNRCDSRSPGNRREWAQSKPSSPSERQKCKAADKRKREREKSRHNLDLPRTMTAAGFHCISYRVYRLCAVCQLLANHTSLMFRNSLFFQIRLFFFVEMFCCLCTHVGKSRTETKSRFNCHFFF